MTRGALWEKLTMIPWHKLPKDVQKSILVMVILSTSTSLTNCRSVPPVICDPAPPPPTRLGPTPSSTLRVIGDTPPATPTAREATPGFTPIICDPAPPPSYTPSPAQMTPVICDPAPPPTFVPSLQHFRVLSSSTENNPQVTIATIRGHVLAPNGIPYRDVEVTARSVDQTITVKTDNMGSYTIHPGEVGPYSVFVLQDEEDQRQFDLNEHDVLTIDWVSVPQPPSSQANTLPLAEIRSVKISHIGGWIFRADTPWPNSRFQWMVSQGTVERNGGEVTWSLSTSPGRHLLQVIADWGAEGIAVDALTLIVQDDGTTEFA